MSSTIIHRHVAAVFYCGIAIKRWHSMYQISLIADRFWRCEWFSYWKRFHFPRIFKPINCETPVGWSWLRCWWVINMLTIRSMELESSKICLRISWNKTKIQNLCFELDADGIFIDGQSVQGLNELYTPWLQAGQQQQFLLRKRSQQRRCQVATAEGHEWWEGGTWRARTYTEVWGAPEEVQGQSLLWGSEPP